MQLQQNIQLARIPHALLVTGAVGVGKQNFAVAFCQRLLCFKGSESGACGECKACQLMIAGTHPDIHYVQLEEKSQALKIDQIRELVVALTKTSQISSRHCVIIEPADRLNVNAANALLKLLEEPPGNSVIVLVSASPHRLTATIRSRCRKLHIDPPSAKTAMVWLKQQGLAEKEAEQALTVARGAPLKALSLYREHGLEQHTAIAKQLAGVLSRHLSVVEAASDLSNREWVDVLDSMLDWTRLTVRNGSSSGGSSHLPVVLQPYLSALPNGEAVFRFYDKLLSIKSQLLSTANPNRQLLWEECLLDWQALVKLAPHPTSGAINAAN